MVKRAELQIVAFKGNGKDKSVKHDQETKAKVPLYKDRRAEKTAHRRFTYALNAQPKLHETYTELSSKEKTRFRELWKDDPGFSYVEQFKSRTMAKVKAEEDKEASI